MDWRQAETRTTATWAGLLLLLAAAGCHNTAQGIRADTGRAVVKTGHGPEKAGDRIAGPQKHGNR